MMDGNKSTQRLHEVNARARACVCVCVCVPEPRQQMLFGRLEERMVVWNLIDKFSKGCIKLVQGLCTCPDVPGGTVTTGAHLSAHSHTSEQDSG